MSNIYTDVIGPTFFWWSPDRAGRHGPFDSQEAALADFRLTELTRVTIDVAAIGPDPIQGFYDPDVGDGAPPPPTWRGRDR